MALYIYVDNSNLWNAGQMVSAFRKGYAASYLDAKQNSVYDPRFRYDFGEIISLLTRNYSLEIAKAYIFGSIPPPNDAVWNKAIEHGFEVKLETRNIANKEKKVDTGLVTKVISESYEFAKPGNDTIVISTGDSDFVPAVENLVNRGFKVEIVFWGNMVSRELQYSATNFIDLEPFMDRITAK